MRLPSWSELIDEQIDILAHPLDESLFVVGPPGSGKTSLAVMRAEMLAQEEYPPKLSHVSTVLVTYNRMLKRLINLLNGGIIVNTMHSFIWNDYHRKTNINPPQSLLDPYEYLWDRMLNNLFKTRRNFPMRMHLIVDEGQDLPSGFFKYAVTYVAKALTVFADEDQALGDGCTSLEEISDAAGLGNPWILSNNHRNAPEIARVAEHFHDGRLPAATVVRRRVWKLPQLVWSPNPSSTAKRISDWYQNRGGRVGVIINTKQFGQTLVDMLRQQLPEARVDYYSSKEKNEMDIQLLEPGVTVLNRRSVKGQEFDSVFILELEAFIPCSTASDGRIMYMMCARARDYLFLVYGPRGLSSAALRSLPGPDFLEREIE